MPRRKKTEKPAWFFRSRAAEPPGERETKKARSGDGVRIYSPHAEDEPFAARRGRKHIASTTQDLPFADFVQEILEEYRSDSSPTRYAMAVELEEEGEQLGPTEDPFPTGGEASVPQLIHAFLNDTEDTDYPLTGEDAEAPVSGTWDWMDILKEFRKERDAEPAPAIDATETTSVELPEEPAVKLPEEPALELPEEPSVELPEETFSEEPAGLPSAEEELPAGFHRLTELRSAPAPTAESAGHLSVEDILAEFRGYSLSEADGAAAAPEDGAEAFDAADPAEEAPAAPVRAESRRARMEREARSLFSRRERETPRRAFEPESTREDAAAPDIPEPRPEAGSPAEELSADFSAPAGTPLPEEDKEGPDGVPAEEAPEGVAAAEKEKTPGLIARLKGLRRAKPRKDRQETPEDGTLGLEDTDASPALYAAESEYDGEEEPEDSFPSFGEYLVGMATGFWLRIRGLGPRSDAGVETMDAEDEELGQEVSPAAASRYYGSHVRSMRFRLRICLILWLVMLYLTVGFPVTGMLRTVDVTAGMLLGLQLGIMLLCLDVVTNTAVNLTRLRFGADSLAVLVCILTSLDALSVLLMGFGSPHVPLCLLSSFSLMGVLYASYLSARGLRKSLRVPAIGRRAYSVTAETELTEKTVTLIKASRPPLGFVRRSEEAAPDETAYGRAAPVLLGLAVLMTLVLVVIKKAPGQFLFILTALLAPAVPVTALMSYAMPFYIGSQRIFTSGAAIAGWSGLCDIGSSHNLIVTDRDLFPDNCVSIETVRIFADIPSEQVIACAGSMITASGSGLASCFGDLMERNGCRMRQVENFEILPGGGLCGTIDGQTVLCGGTELMRLMNVRIPYRLIDKTTVLLAIDGVLYGIFNIKYEANPTVRKALLGLMRSNRHPVFAIRDFNINPEMLHDTFDVATDGYDFPPYLERYTISEALPSERRKIAAVLCREGLGPLVHMADTGRSMYLTVRINLMISLLSSVIGVLAVFLLLLTSGTIAPGAMLLYAVFWIVPITLISLFLRL